jgi:glycosyltransferase involved in cell wall biosynthesis
LVAHTIFADPTPHQRSVLVELAGLADHVVVMSEAGRQRLCDGHGVDPRKVTIIPRGATVPKRVPPTARRGRPMLLTWGLLGPGKGVERVIDAMVSLSDLTCQPRYVVAGRTHPKVLDSEGESYRTARVEQAENLGLTGSVTFDGAYRDTPTLSALVQSAAAVVLPYDSTEQVCSGVLVDAIASGRPVIATAFPHAIELLGSGAGIVVAHDDPDALATALRQVLTEPRMAGDMAAEARRLAPAMAWSVVSTAYSGLAWRLLSKRPAVA